MPTAHGIRLSINDYAVRLEAAPRAEAHNASYKVISLGRSLSDLRSFHEQQVIALKTANM